MSFQFMQTMILSGNSLLLHGIIISLIISTMNGHKTFAIYNGIYYSNNLCRQVYHSALFAIRLLLLLPPSILCLIIGITIVSLEIIFYFLSNRKWNALITNWMPRDSPGSNARLWWVSWEHQIELFHQPGHWILKWNYRLAYLLGTYLEEALPRWPDNVHRDSGTPLHTRPCMADT